MKSKIILMLVISSLIIGCVDDPKSISSNNEISETITSITYKLLGDSCSSSSGIGSQKLTTEQCDYWVENNINNKFVKWSGIVSDVKDGVVYVKVNYQMPNGLNRDAIVKLYGIRKDEILKYNILDNIHFSGKINIEKQIGGYVSSWQEMINNIYGFGKVIELHDSKIITPDNTTNVQSGISSGTPTEPSITSGISKISSNVPISKTFDVSYKKINDSYIQIIVKNIGKESVSNFIFNIGSQSSPVLGNLNPEEYLSATFNIKEILGKDNNIDVRIFYVWSGHPNSEVLRIPITT